MMQQRTQYQNQQGFTVGSLVMVLLLIAAVFGTYQFVRRASQDSAKQGAKLGNALAGDGDVQEQSGGSGEPSTNKSSTDQSQLWENPIKTVNVDIDTLTAAFTITLPGTYQGTCTLEIWQPGQTKKRRFVEELKGTKTCTLYVPLKELKDSKIWRFQAGYFSDDGRTYGKHAESTFSL